MGLRTRFPRSDVDELEHRLARVRASAEGLELAAEDWILDALDPRRAFDRIPELWIRDGWSLRCAHRRSADGIRCALWAEPSEARSPTFREEFLAREDPFEAVDGEPGAWSYLLASILRRELGEWGAVGAFRRWTKHELVCEQPPATSFELPEDLRPEVVEDNTRISVRFWTRRVDGDLLRIYEHRDLYRALGFSHESSARLLGSAPLLDAEGR